jgi:hypothetical protein
MHTFFPEKLSPPLLHVPQIFTIIYNTAKIRVLIVNPDLYPVYIHFFSILQYPDMRYVFERHNAEEKHKKSTLISFEKFLG